MTAALTCSSCGEANDRSPQRYCSTCHAAYQANYRHRLTMERRISSRRTAGNAVQSGEIKRQPCMVCGAAAQMHHPDHEHPKLVFWLCRDHHMAWHFHWKEVVLQIFAEWIGVARACQAVRDSEATAPSERKAA